MNNRTLKRTTLNIAVAGAAALLWACAMAPTMDKPNVPPQGATWRHALTLTGSYGKGNRVAQTTMGMGSWQGHSMRAMQSQPSTTFVNQDGCWVGIAVNGKPTFSFDPPICYRFPIAVGNAWSDQRRMMIIPAKRTLNLESNWKVEAYEDVSVPAGTFGAYRITYSDNNGTDRVDWFSPELGLWVKSSVKRSAKNPSGPGTMESVLVSQTITK